MLNHIQCVCPSCQRTVAIPAGAAPASPLRCPRCQQTFPWPAQEAATRSLAPTPHVPPTVPPASLRAAHQAAAPSADVSQATCTLDPQRLAKGEASAARPKPKAIGRFEIRRVLGEGGFGIVYEAYDPQLDRAIALKVAKLGGDSEQRIKRFLREAKSAANLRHPHIVPLYEFGQDGDQFYLALAYIPGQSLNQVLSELNAKKEKMNCRRAATLVRHLAEALAYAHGLGIVHRDIKPHNAMLDERGDPLLMDFGLAAREMDEKLTREGAIMGTAAYLAPEQYRGEPTAASDQYSLGVTLYELLTGATPFAWPADMQIYHHVNTEPESPRKRNPAVTRDLATICLKCLEKDAARRYVDCRAAAADDLRRWLDGDPILARRIGVSERVRKWSRKNPLSALLLGTVMLTLTVGATVAGTLAVEANHQAGLAVEEAQRANLSETKEKKAREEAELSERNEKKAREEAEERGIRIQFEHYLSKAEARPDLALVGMASLLPTAARLTHQARADVLRCQVAAWRGRVISWTATCEHQDRINAIALSADGKLALTGSEDNTARLWETATGEAVGPPLQHHGSIVAVALSADGKIALTGSRDNTARLWETATGKPIGRPLEHQGSVLAVALSADGKIAVTGGTDKLARLWETGTGIPIGTPLAAAMRGAQHVAPSLLRRHDQFDCVRRNNWARQDGAALGYSNRQAARTTAAAQTAIRN